MAVHLRKTAAPQHRSRRYVSILFLPHRRFGEPIICIMTFHKKKNLQVDHHVDDEQDLLPLDDDDDTVTEVGPMIKDTMQPPRRVAPSQQRSRSTTTRHLATPSREQLTALIDALGDPHHPDHYRAFEELVALKTAALPILSEALNPMYPWLGAYRAAEAMGRIGSGRATGALIQALHHPNSNVRWSAVQALAHIGDFRALMELRRVARVDQGKTSWGESVAESAQSALEQMRTQSVWGQSLELMKTALTSVLMILSLVLAFSVISTLRDELNRISMSVPAEPMIQDALVERSDLPPETDLSEPPLPADDGQDDRNAAATDLPATAGADELIGTVLQLANVRPAPNVNNQPIGLLRQNDQVVFLARTPDGQWYRVRLGPRASDSVINNPDGTNSGWVNRALLSPPPGDVPVEDPSSGS